MPVLRLRPHRRAPPLATAAPTELILSSFRNIDTLHQVEPKRLSDSAFLPLIGISLLLLAPALRVARALVPLASVPRLIPPELRIFRQMSRGYYYFLLVVLGLGVSMVLFSAGG